MYTLITNTGQVYRDSDNVLIAPCQDTTNQNYIDYVNWVTAGNAPTEVSSPGDNYNYIGNGNFQYDLTLAKNEQIDIILASLQNDLQYLPVQVSSGQLLLANTLQDQTNALLAISIIQNVTLTSKPWAPNTPYTTGSFCVSNGVYLYCAQGGTSGNTELVNPSTFSLPTQDGTVYWELFGQLLGLYPTGVAWLTPQDIVAATAQANLYVIEKRQKYQMLKTQINNSTDVTTIQSIVW